MGLLSIIGRLVLDGSQFDATLSKADKKASQFAGGLTKKFVGATAGFMGFNALKQLGLDAIENAAEITKLAKAFNITTDQVQLLQKEAEATGKPFADLVKDADQLEATLSRLEGGEVIFSEQTVKNLTMASEVIKTFKEAAGQRVTGLIGWALGARGAEALSPGQQAFEEILNQRKRQEEEYKKGAKDRLKEEEKIKKINDEAKELEEKTELDKLSKAEQLNKLTEKRRQMVEEIAKFEYMPGSEGAANDRLRVAKLDNQIANLKGDATSTTKSRKYEPLSDSLTSVGNFLGANPNAETRNQLTEANRTLKSIERKLETRTGSAFPL